MAGPKKLGTWVACATLAACLSLVSTVATAGTDPVPDTPGPSATGPSPESAPEVSPEATSLETVGTDLPTIQTPDTANSPAPLAAAALPPTDPVDWVTLFPDLALRTAIQDRLAASTGILPGAAIMQDLDLVTYLNADNLGIESLDGLQHLPNLYELHVSHNQITSIQLITSLPELHYVFATDNQISSLTLPITNSLDSLDLARNPACPSVDFIRGGNTQSFNLNSCTFLNTRLNTMGGAYTIDGNRYTYVYADGDGSFAFGFSSLVDIYGDAVLDLASAPRGGSSSVIQHLAETPGDGIRRDEIRTVEANGSIKHTVTMTNVSATNLDSAFYQGMDTELNGNDFMPLLADGNGGVIIGDSAMTVYFQPISGIDQVYTGGYGGPTETVLKSRIADGTVISAAGRPLFDVLAQGVDSFVYYATPRITLAPGESYTFSYRESLFAATDPFLIRVDYVTANPSTGQDMVLDSASFEGVDGEILDLTGLPGLPAGYESDTAAGNPTQAIYGTQGPLTIVTIRVVEAASPTPTPTTPAPTSPATSTPTVDSTRPPSTEQLAVTGVNILLTLAGAAALTAIGTIVIRRRRNA